jgi:hypothetical protein
MHGELTIVAVGGLVAAGACAGSPLPEVRVGASAPEVASPTATQRGNPEVGRLDEAGERPPQTTSADRPEMTRASPGGTPPTGMPPITTPLTTTLPASPSGSGIQGRVAMWPSCPVESNNPDCAPRPLASRVVVSRRSGERITTADTRNDGRFRVGLPPSDYVVEAQAEGVLCAPVDVTVPSGHYVRVELNCDTGVR